MVARILARSYSSIELSVIGMRSFVCSSIPLHWESILKQSLLFAARLLGLVISYFLAFAIISGTLLPRIEQSQSEAGTALVALLAIAILNTCALTYVTLRSRWNGLKLILALWFALFGVLTLMSQIETAVFIRTLPQGFLPRIFLVGFLFSGVFAFLLTLVLGKRKRSEESNSTSNRLQMPISSWIYKLAIIAVVYVIIYFTFGYFFAWSSPAVREYYGGGEYNGLLRQFIHVWQQSPWLFPLQVFRALLWTAIAIPVIKMTKGAWWEAGLAVALLFSVVMNTQLLLPNPLMPYEVRMAHLVETASSNFLFAWILVWLLINEKADHRKERTLETRNLSGHA